MTVSWIINFKSIQYGSTVVRGRKHLSDPIFSYTYCTVLSRAQLGRWQLFPLELYLILPASTSFTPPPHPTSHSSHFLISLLLSIGVGVIGYFTHVRVELAEGKGQATRLSASCTTVIHQLLSGTRKATAALSRHFVRPHPGLPG